ncbi:MAG: TolC family protein [Flavobacteriaceae bacterium]|nr:TolC family protein [Bacteroidia bacterium]NNK82730.1 TolC family protein [Flavobacteriaceae bacterium]
MKQIITIFLAFLVSISFAQEKKVWTLLECVNHALENNISVKQGENNILSNEQDVIASKSQFLPSVSGNLGHSLSIGTRELFPGQFVDRTDNSTSVTIGASHTIFNGFRLTNLYKQSQLNLETNQLELSRIKDDISLNVANAYLNVLFNIENLEIAQAQFDFTKKQLNQVKNLVEAGVQPQANIFDAEANLSSDAQNLTVAKNNYDLAILTLTQLLQLPLEGFEVEVVNIDTPSAELMYNDARPIVNNALENRYEVKVAEKNIENATLGIDISKSGFLPSVTFNYGFGSNAFFTNLTDTEDPFFEQLNNQKGHRFSLNVGIPIFSQNRNKTNVAKAKIQTENAKLGLAQTKLSVEANVQRAFTDAKAAFKAYQAAKVNLEAQRFAFDNAQERYNIGALNSFDLEQIRFRFLNAQSSLVNSKYDFVFKTKVLDFYMGKEIKF